MTILVRNSKQKIQLNHFDPYLKETFTGQVPYPDKSEHRVIILVMVQKIPPERPEIHMPPGNRRGDALWSLLLRCWANEPGERPNASEVAKTIYEFVDQHEELPSYQVQVQASPHPHTPLPLTAVSIPLEPPLVVDPAFEDANILHTLVQLLAQSDPIRRPVPAPTASSEYALHDIGARVFEMLVAGGKRVHGFAARAWANAVGASPGCDETVVAIVAVTRGSPPVFVVESSFDDLDSVGSDALRACALLCLGVPGSELVLAKRLEEGWWGENVPGLGHDEGRRRAWGVFVELAAANILGAAKAAAELQNSEETSLWLSRMPPCLPVKWPPPVKYQQNLNARPELVVMKATKIDTPRLRRIGTDH
ncbi:hypothetical protein FRC12_000827 [Ceratobasidium sp. 428]|nr:hypothetical protein FRC12_000827 [Ceratobasidium sp. 428]